MQFIEDNSYPFIVHNLIEISDELFYILTDSDGNKHLLPEEPYKYYKLETGKTIHCRIDKINCSGKIFLEPEHPVFKPSVLYNFKYEGKHKIINSFGETELHYTVSDQLGNKWNVPVIADLPFTKPQNTVPLKVYSIKKGKPLLLYNFVENIGAKLKIGERHKFLVLGMSTLIHGKEFIRLKDDDDNIHFIRYKFYADYGFKSGDYVFCTVVKEERVAGYYLEPDYPDYDILKTYPFNFVKMDKYYHKDGSSENCLLVKDKNGKECIVFYKAANMNIQDNAIIYAKIEYIFKGKLFAKLVSDEKK